jgi:hypothetical protein
MPRHSVSHAPQRTTYSITPPSAASLMRPVTCDSVPGTQAGLRVHALVRLMSVRLWLRASLAPDSCVRACIDGWNGATCIEGTEAAKPCYPSLIRRESRRHTGASHREPPVVHRRGSRISRQRSASSQGKKSVSSPVATLMHELSDAPRPVDLSRRRSSVAGSQVCVCMPHRGLSTGAL